MNFESLCQQIHSDLHMEKFGFVKHVAQNHVLITMPRARVGMLCEIQSAHASIPVEIVSLTSEGHVAMPLNDLRGAALGDCVRTIENEASVPVGNELLGRVVDSLGSPYDGEPLRLSQRVSLYGAPSNPLERAIIDEVLDLGVASLNACLTCGKGQRQGIFAGSGVGKSVLLGMMARFTEADVVVVGLIGERTREVREFIEREIGADGKQKCVFVVETAEKSAIRRVRGANTAVAYAEYFRSQGLNVLLLVDSLTRFAMAQREIGLSAGEPPASKGYPPSVYRTMSSLVERAGNWGNAGSITGLYTVLVEGDDMDDPVADCARSLLDGHIVLSRKLANKGHYPAVDVLSSVSRVMDDIVSKEQVRHSRLVRQVLSRFSENEDAIHYGMYVKGTDAVLDECINLEPRVNSFLKQPREQKRPYSSAVNELEGLFSSNEA